MTHEMGAIEGTHDMECFISDEDLAESDLEFPDEVTETFTVEVGQAEYYRSHLWDLAAEMKSEYGYYFEVGKLADALYHLRKLDGFLTNEVLITDVTAQDTRSQSNTGRTRCIRCVSGFQKTAGTFSHQCTTRRIEMSSDSMECPECGSEITEKDPLLGLWICDDCEIGFNDKGAVIAE